MVDIDALVAKCKADGASDLHLICGLPPKYRKDGQLQDMSDTPLTKQDCEDMARFLAGDQYEKMAKIGEVDAAGSWGGNRCRVHLFRSQGTPSLALRLLREEIPKLENLGLPPAAMDLTGMHKGIILVTGETGSGKSTTLAAMLDYINHHRRDHIVTLEDPVEYLYTPDLCAINQREIGKDTVSFSDRPPCLRHPAYRQRLRLGRPYCPGLPRGHADPDPPAAEYVPSGRPDPAACPQEGRRTCSGC